MSVLSLEQLCRTVNAAKERKRLRDQIRRITDGKEGFTVSLNLKDHHLETFVDNLDDPTGSMKDAVYDAVVQELRRRIYEHERTISNAGVWIEE